MGAGQGKTRRVNATRLPSAAYQLREWQGFVEDIELTGIMTYEYYLGRKGDRGRTLQERNKVVAEVFSDAVAASAIVLPAPYEADDFEFQLSDTQDHASWAQQLKIVLKNHHGARKLETGWNHTYLGSDCFLMSAAVESFLEQTARSVTGLVRRDERRARRKTSA